MKEYIQNLRSKPEIVRKQYLLGFMIVSVVVVGSIWAYGLTSHFTARVSEKAKEDIKPFALFTEGLKNTYGNITASSGSVDTESSVEVKDKGKVISLTPVELPTQ